MKNKKILSILIILILAIGICLPVLASSMPGDNARGAVGDEPVQMYLLLILNL